MSNSSHFQPWKENAPILNSTNDNYFTKTDAVPISNATATNSTMSSMSADLYMQLGLSKFGDFDKMENMDKLNEIGIHIDMDMEDKEHTFQQLVESAIR